MVDDITNIAQEMIRLAVSIQQIPAPTFFEGQRSAFIKELFAQRNLADVTVDEAGNVFARLPGLRKSPPAIFSAHLDTVFPADTDLGIRYDGDVIYGPGIGDNALGVAGLCGLVDALRESDQLAGDIWLAANVCEEGLGDLRGMKAVVERFGRDVLAYVVIEGSTLGKIYHRAVGVERYRIEVKTPGGHSWSSFGKPSAIHELARLVTQITQLDVPSQPRTTLNVGTFRGGMSINTIAPEAEIEVDLRSEDANALADLVERLKCLVREANQNGADFVSVHAEMIGQRPAGEIPPDHLLVQLASRCLETQGIVPNLGIGSTDANLPLSLGLPAVCVGLTRGSGSHTVNEMIQTKPAILGLKMLKALAEGIFQELT
jgi:tripeptide aminopeptidase